MIRIENLSKAFDDKNILDNVSLHLSSQQTHVILGSSGSGKSTLLRVVLGLLPYEKGNIFLDELSVSPKTQADVAKITGYVVQSVALFPHLTCADNVALVPHALRWEKSKISRRIQELAELVDLEITLLQKFPRQLR